MNETNFYYDLMDPTGEEKRKKTSELALRLAHQDLFFGNFLLMLKEFEKELSKNQCAEFDRRFELAKEKHRLERN